MTDNVPSPLSEDWRRIGPHDGMRALAMETANAAISECDDPKVRALLALRRDWMADQIELIMLRSLVQQMGEQMSYPEGAELRDRPANGHA